MQLIIQVDESYFNKLKPGKLSKGGRPQRDQVWVWGAAVQNIPNFFFFAVLEHPMDVYDGKPRGCNEIASKVQHLGLPHEESKITVVSDTWKGTVAGIKKYRTETGVSATDFPHELVNHSYGEIVNANGYTTNGIEAKWSLVKR